MIGTFTNTALVIFGSLIGLWLKKGIPENIKNIILIGLGIFTCLLGVKMGIQMEKPVVIIISLVLGGIIGELINIELLIERIGEKFKKIGSLSESETFAQGFVTASVLFSIGPMTILGCIQDGLLNRPELLITKSIMDGVSAIILTSTLGIGVLFSALVVFLFQGSMTLLARQLHFLGTSYFLNDFTGTGGMLVFAIGIRLLGIKDIKVGNFLPALILVIVLKLIFRF
ncbi:MAG: DUF554 domain-containing protein [candidate division WOR-3 bacterium]|nr:DUF554 domain-containing protein [candidate division WOR-3 bacterium]